MVDKTRKERENTPNSLGKVIVDIHNVSQSLAWQSYAILIKFRFYLLGKALVNLSNNFQGTVYSLKLTDPHFIKVYQIVQFLQILEIFFSFLKWQKTNLMALLPQTFGRCFFGFFTLPLALNGTPLVFLCIFMFCIVESFRYAFYFLKSNGKDESLIGKFFGLIRYNTFLVCYPLGAGSECLVVYEVAKRIRKEMPDRFSIRMPNKVNFAFDMTYCMYFMIVMYGAVFPKLYTYLLRQRKAYMEGYNKNKKE